MLSLLLARMTTSSPKPTPGGTPRITTLDRVRSNHEIEVLKITGTRDEINSLTQLGIRVGEVLRVKRAAPLGGAILVETADRSVALGRALAGKVKIQLRT